MKFRCVGKISLPPGGDTIVVDPGTAKVEIAWDFDDTLKAGSARRWRFVTKSEPLAVIFGTGSSVIKLSSLLEFDIKDKATLVLKNVSGSYNGTYEFSINDGSLPPETSHVSVFIAGKCLFTVSSPHFLKLDEKLKKMFLGFRKWSKLFFLT